jgi:hypothetical protein
MVRCKKICTSLKKDKIYTKKKFWITKYNGLRFTYLLGYNCLNLLLKFFYYMMLSFFSKQKGRPLINNEKLIILSVHNYSSKINFTEKSYLKLKLCK